MEFWKQGWEQTDRRRILKSLVTNDGKYRLDKPLSEDEDYAFGLLANTQTQTQRETIKNQFTHSQKPKVDKTELGYGFTLRACFVCGSLNHVIRDCDFHEKMMARKAELKNGWNNMQRVNKQNQFVPSAVLTRTGKIPVNTAITSSTKNFTTARQSFNRRTSLTSTAMKVHTVNPIVNRVRPANVSQKTHSPYLRPFKKTTVLRTVFSKQKVNTAKVTAVSTVGGKRETEVKPSAGCNWRPQRYNWHNAHDCKHCLPCRNFKTLMVALFALEVVKGFITGKEFKNKDFIEFCGSKGIKREYSNVRTPQQNGVAERKNRERTGPLLRLLGPCLQIHFYLTLFGLKQLVLLVISENQANIDAGQQEANHNADEKRECLREEEQAFWDELERLQRKEKEANEEAEALRKEFAQETENLVIQAGAAKASNDSEIPPLEDIYQNYTNGIFTNSSYDDEGAVADFTNLETVINVSPIPTSRIIFSHSSALILGDPTSAVQTRSKVNKSSGAYAFVSYVQKQRRNNHKDFQHCLFACFLSQNEPKKISEVLEDESWVDAMQEELL
ncbi:putative ribonuclease H-like domain-containing protein [Tanacetum coccineum]